MNAATLVCSSCDTGINADEIVAGLAVRIDGNLLCSTCIETLPSEAQVGINRVRALRGMHVTTYRVPIEELPHTALFTFTTSSQLNFHRRQLVATGTFAAPLLPPPHQRPELPGSAPPAPTTDRPRATGRRSLLIGLGVGAGVLALGGAAVAIAAYGGREGGRPVTVEQNPPAVIARAVPTAPAPSAKPTVASLPATPSATPPRHDPSDDPLAAWIGAKADASCPPAVLAELAQPVIDMRSAQLDAAERALDAGRPDEARLRLRMMRVPADPSFVALKQRESELTARATASPTSTPPPPSPPEPVTPIVAQPEVVAREAPAETLPPTAPEPPPPLPPPAAATDRPGDDATVANLFAEGTVTGWLPAFALPPRAVEEAKDGSALLPSPWPLGTAFFYRAVKSPTGSRRYALGLEIPSAKVADGGLAVLLHRGAVGRATLAVSVQSGAVSTPLAPLLLDHGWQKLAINVPAGSTSTDTFVLRLEDGDDKSPERGFVLGKVVLVAGRAPAVDDLAVEPAPLLGDDPLLEPETRTRFRALLAKVQQRRPAKARTVSVNQLALAVANLDIETTAALRKALVPLLARELTASDFINLSLTATAWEDRQFGAGDALNPDVISVVAFCPNAREVAALAQPDAFSAWLQRQLGAIIAGDAKGKRVGLLPVVVIGALAPSPAAADPATLGTLWEPALGECARMGIPVIDVRAAQAAPAKEHRAKAARLLVEGLRTLGFQLNATQRSSR